MGYVQSPKKKREYQISNEEGKKRTRIDFTHR